MLLWPLPNEWLSYISNRSAIVTATDQQRVQLTSSCHPGTVARSSGWLPQRSKHIQELQV